MNKPNIFKYATKELSQDAFIFWLLDHANPEYENVDPKIKDLAYSLLKCIFELENVKFPEKIKKLKLEKQYKKIDVLCQINDEFIILIEDKTRTTAHGGQLLRYKTIIQEDFKDHKIIAIFFKTFDQSNYKEIEEDGYKVLNRYHFLKVLNSIQPISNQIFNEYLEYLTEIETRVQAFSTIPIDQWSDSYFQGLPWDGFFQFIQKEFPEGDWGYVPNQKGGFMGYWWAFQKNANCWQYLQIQEKELVLKINALGSHQHRQYREYCYNHFLSFSKLENLNFLKPQKFGSGNTITILKSEYIVRNCETKLVDLKATIENLKLYTRFIEKYALNDKDFLF